MFFMLSVYFAFTLHCQPCASEDNSLDTSTCSDVHVQEGFCKLDSAPVIVLVKMVV